MEVFRQREEIIRFLSNHRESERKLNIHFVPTMGALHEGHLALIRAAKAKNSLLVVSIFVNPTQFNSPEDFEQYPRQEAQDLQSLQKMGVNAVFIPETNELYKSKIITSVSFGELGAKLEGAFRPGHFNGVGLIVSKLFNIIKPDAAFFGQKDFQQFTIISQLVRDLDFPVRLTCVPTVREADGLAMSSRNVRLNPEQRKDAPVLYQSLRYAEDQLKRGKKMATIKEEVKENFRAKNATLEYIELTDSELNVLESYATPSVLLIAGGVGNVRLIDNILL